MFSRRHPYLFTLLVFSAIGAVALVGVSVAALVAAKTIGGEPFGGDGGGNVGVIEIDGVIADSRQVLEEIKRFREQEEIRAIVVRIDSPGGVVGPAQEIYREIRKTLKHKKVVASMGAVAASGGYYIAAAADKIVASPGTITGSIGVIMGFANYEQLLQKIGLTPVVIKSGEYKDTGSPVRPMRPEERRMLEAFAEKIHNQFIADVASGRGMDAERVRSLADGRILTGEESKALGLVDRLGNFEDALEWAGRLGGVQDPVSPVYAREKRLGFVDYLLRNQSIRALIDRLLTPRVQAAYLMTVADGGP